VVPVRWTRIFTDASVEPRIDPLEFRLALIQPDSNGSDGGGAYDDNVFPIVVVNVSSFYTEIRENLSNVGG